MKKRWWDPDSAKWLEAMKSEMRSMYKNKVWTLVDLPDDRRAIENKGFRKVQGVDYDETFSPVAMLKSVQIMLAIAAFYNYEIWQMDVKTAFLKWFLKEELYMMQPEGFVNPKGANKMCKLQRSIYGLVQASRSWNICFDELIKAYDFIQTFWRSLMLMVMLRSTKLELSRKVFDKFKELTTMRLSHL